MSACPRRCTLLLLILTALLLAWATPAAAQGALERIRRRGQLVVATDATYPPFESTADGQLEGFDIDLGNEIGRELGVELRWEPMAWDGVMGALETGKVDLIMSGVTITAERKKKGSVFTRPYFLSGQTIARRRGDATVGSVNDLRGKTVAVQQETTGQFALEQRGIPDDSIRKFDVLQDALLDVRNGNSAAAVGDEPALREIIRKGYPELELVGGVFVQEKLGIVARRGELDLVAAINQAIDRIMVDGRYMRIYNRTIGQPLSMETLADLEEAEGEGTPIPRQIVAAGAAAVSGAPSPAGTVDDGSALTIRWGLLREAMPDLLMGARMTLFVTLLTLLIGAPAGLIIALARLSIFKPLQLVATTYVEIVRGTPLLMQIYVIYFVLPALNINLPPLGAAVSALSLNAAAYISEIFRAGIQSIDSGQMEAARSLGMDYRAAMRWVILPQTVRRVLPPLTNEAVALLKDSSLVSVVALSELMRRGKEIATTAGSPITVYLAVALLYLAMTLPLTYLVRRLEAHWQPVSRPRERKPAVPALESSGKSA